MKPAALPRIIIICGPTASGKSELAVRLARERNGEIVNADSLQIYRGMDIGTAKPTMAEQGGIAHHLIDVVDPDQPFSAADFAEAANRSIAGIVNRRKLPIVVGGTGLYIRALLHGLVDSPSGDETLRQELQAEAREKGNRAMLEQLSKVDPELGQRTHINNLVRIIRGLEVYRLTGIPLSRHQQEHGFSDLRYHTLQLGIRVDRRELYARINARVDRMLADGLLDEVQGLLARGFGSGLKAMKSIGYKESAACLAGEYSRDEAARLIKRNTRHYAKRQLTWFNSVSDIIWLEYPENFATILLHAIEFIDRQEA
jgi:tRNA dimethylallyltransferase